MQTHLCNFQFMWFTREKIHPGVWVDISSDISCISFIFSGPFMRWRKPVSLLWRWILLFFIIIIIMRLFFWFYGKKKCQVILFFSLLSCLLSLDCWTATRYLEHIVSGIEIWGKKTGITTGLVHAPMKRKIFFLFWRYQWMLKVPVYMNFILIIYVNHS